MPAAIQTTGRWLGPGDAPLLGWLTTPRAGVGRSGVLVLPPMGYAYWSTHRTLRTLAERLAGAGHAVLRVDYHGTGDSSGEPSDPDRVAAWRATVHAGVAELRAAGCTALTLVGARLGGTLALLEGAEASADAVVAWLPAARGHRYARELRFAGTRVPDEAGWPAGTISVAGSVFTGATLEAIKGLDLTRLERRPAARVLLVGEEVELGLVERLEGLGCPTTVTRTAGGPEAMDVATEDATVPEDLVAAVAGWVGPSGAGGPAPPPRPSARLPWRGTALDERVGRWGAAGLVGVLTTPSGSHGPTTVVLLNAGSESHVGSGRAWVEYARELAAAGHRTLRLDFRGWGESPDDGRAPGRPYDAHGVQDALAAVAALRQDGHARVVLLGLCAGAWIALDAARRGPVDGVVALNPQLYWGPGDPVEALLADTRARRAPERARIERWRARGAWTLLDLAGHRNPAARWLDDLAGGGAVVGLVFSEGDDGLDYLRSRLGRRLSRARARGLRVLEVPGVDHSAHRAWLRPRVVEAIRDVLGDAAAGRGPQAPRR